MITQIKPITKTISSVDIQPVLVDLNNSASFSVYLLTEENLIYRQYKVDITPEEYSAWGSSDEYIVDLVLSKLQLERE